MYCIRCGVELSEGQRACPLCKTKVCHPDFASDETLLTYPDKEFKSEEFNKKGLLFIISILTALMIALPIIIELSIHLKISWSGYAAGGIMLVYLFFILPLWFKHPNPVVFVPCDFVATALFIMYVNMQTGGNWFLPFALPVVGIFGIIVITFVTLLRYLRKGRLYIFGGNLMALGIWTIMLEVLIRITFGVGKYVFWSLFSAITLFVLGMMLIVIAIVKPFRESLYKKFFV